MLFVGSFASTAAALLITPSLLLSSGTATAPPPRDGSRLTAAHPGSEHAWGRGGGGGHRGRDNRRGHGHGHGAPWGDTDPWDPAEPWDPEGSEQPWGPGTDPWDPTDPTDPIPTDPILVGPPWIPTPLPPWSPAPSDPSEPSDPPGSPDPTPPPAVPTGPSFTLATFNVLGHSHTKPGGNKPGWPQAGARMRAAVQTLRGHDVDLVGFQELQSLQKREFARLAKGWQVFHPPRDPENAVAWDTDAFTFVDAWTLPIPYFNGRARHMPIVTLRDNASGQVIRLLNVHNPADTHRYRHQGRYRAEATRREIAAAQRLNSRKVPLLVTGDMNERTKFFCTFTADGQMKAAAGGSNVDGTCTPPTFGLIDWIFGSALATFSDFAVDRTTLQRKISDHPMVIARVWPAAEGGAADQGPAG
jgi:endonuclease/exonuclease/phosphatase family metal-dependent hydrolase